MKRTTSAAMAFVLAALVLAGTATAGADVVRERIVIDVTGGVEDACDEPILLTAGQVVETIQVFDDGNGRTHFLYQVQTFGVVGVGLESGATYRDLTHVTQSGIASIDEGFGTGGFIVQVRIVSKDGTVADLRFRQSFHIVKRDGVNRVLMDRVTFTCS